jgi:hypothetical protein
VFYRLVAKNVTFILCDISELNLFTGLLNVQILSFDYSNNSMNFNRCSTLHFDKYEVFFPTNALFIKT